MPRDNHIPTEPNVLTFGPESARGESEARTKIKQKNRAESKVVIATLFLLSNYALFVNLLSQ